MTPKQFLALSSLFRILGVVLMFIAVFLPDGAVRVSCAGLLMVIDGALMKIFTRDEK